MLGRETNDDEEIWQWGNASDGKEFETPFFIKILCFVCPKRYGKDSTKANYNSGLEVSYTLPNTSSQGRILAH